MQHFSAAHTRSKWTAFTKDDHSIMQILIAASNLNIKLKRNINIQASANSCLRKKKKVFIFFRLDAWWLS